MKDSDIDNTKVAKPVRVAIIGASGAYGKGILARAEEIGVEAVVVTRSPHKFKEVKTTTTVVDAQLNEEEKLREAFRGCEGVISALGDNRKERPKTHNLPVRLESHESCRGHQVRRNGIRPDDDARREAW